MAPTSSLLDVTGGRATHATRIRPRVGRVQAIAGNGVAGESGKLEAVTGKLTMTFVHGWRPSSSSRLGWRSSGAKGGIPPEVSAGLVDREGGAGLGDVVKAWGSALDGEHGGVRRCVHVHAGDASRRCVRPPTVEPAVAQHDAFDGGVVEDGFLKCDDSTRSDRLWCVLRGVQGIVFAVGQRAWGI